ncbi:hypothetical protein TRFO_15206 [Tritrichomonas foetus]|uniref:Uncharacterized protein n=1 Tax=Tritrichomonas foetus TaxID=1144522 RepID=A0A1J4KT02_9EUKA|nr:hypothetical protein TRFO_15206 [Tritrichomonas foetus]|eukprot:OHT14425.1 hypothetical protein TRFO_15206 [Tritrichomonas foetus]
MFSDFEDLFANSQSPNHPPGQGCCDLPFNDTMSLQSPFSMPTINNSNLEYSSGMNDSECSISSGCPKPYTDNRNLRNADFSNQNDPFLAQYGMTKIRFDSVHTNSQIPEPILPKSTSKININRTINMNNIHDINSRVNIIPLNNCLNSINMMTSTMSMPCLNKQNVKAPEKIRIGQLTQKAKPEKMVKQIFRPFASIESCELTVDRLRSFVEIRKMKVRQT